MKLCPKCSPRDSRAAICDFCKHYRFNGDAEGTYVGDGRCEHPDHPAPREPDEMCEDFHCSMAEVSA